MNDGPRTTRVGPDLHIDPLRRGDDRGRNPRERPERKKEEEPETPPPVEEDSDVGRHIDRRV